MSSQQVENYDDVTDYNGLNDTTGAKDKTDSVIPGLSGYNVSVIVSSVTLNANPAKKILVTVTYDGDAKFTLPLTAYRLN